VLNLVGKNKKTVIYYKDLIKMVLNIAQDNETIGKTVICGTEVLTINEINRILISKNKKKVFMIRIPTVITSIAIKLCCFSKLKKIRRKIIALIQNNEFDINESKRYITEYKRFEEFQNDSK